MHADDQYKILLRKGIDPFGDKGIDGWKIVCSATASFSRW
jgi:hypothetical protein